MSSYTITTVKARDLDLTHIDTMVEVNGASGSLLGYRPSVTPRPGRYLYLSDHSKNGPDNVQEIRVDDETDIKVLEWRLGNN